MLLLGINAASATRRVPRCRLSALDLDGLARLPAAEDRHRPPLPPLAGDRGRDPGGPGGAAGAPKEEADADLVFITTRGTSAGFVPRRRAVASTTSIRCGWQFSKLMKTLGIDDRGRGFYTLRHVFRTIADAARDPVAIDLIMGHTDPSMGGHYRERIEDSRLQAVAEHVRRGCSARPLTTARPANRTARPPKTATLTNRPSRWSRTTTEAG